MLLDENLANENAMDDFAKIEPITKSKKKRQNKKRAKEYISIDSYLVVDQDITKFNSFNMSIDDNTLILQPKNNKTANIRHHFEFTKIYTEKDRDDLLLNDMEPAIQEFTEGKNVLLMFDLYERAKIIIGAIINQAKPTISIVEMVDHTYFDLLSNDHIEFKLPQSINYFEHPANVAIKSIQSSEEIAKIVHEKENPILISFRIDSSMLAIVCNLIEIKYLRALRKSINLSDPPVLYEFLHPYFNENSKIRIFISINSSDTKFKLLTTRLKVLAKQSYSTIDESLAKLEAGTNNPCINVQDLQKEPIETSSIGVQNVIDKFDAEIQVFLQDQQTDEKTPNNHICNEQESENILSLMNHSNSLHNYTKLNDKEEINELIKHLIGKSQSELEDLSKKIENQKNTLKQLEQLQLMEKSKLELQKESIQSLDFQHNLVNDSITNYLIEKEQLYEFIQRAMNITELLKQIHEFEKEKTELESVELDHQHSFKKKYICLNSQVHINTQEMESDFLSLETEIEDFLI